MQHAPCGPVFSNGASHRKGAKSAENHQNSKNFSPAPPSDHDRPTAHTVLLSVLRVFAVNRLLFQSSCFRVPLGISEATAWRCTRTLTLGAASISTKFSPTSVILPSRPPLVTTSS